MYYILLNKNSNNLVDISDTEFNYTIDENLIVQTREGDIPDLLKYHWNPSIQDFSEKYHKILSKLEFLSKFTMQERIAFRSSVDPIVMDIMQMLDLAEFINLEDEKTVQSLYYLNQIGILTPTRLQEILT